MMSKVAQGERLKTTTDNLLIDLRQQKAEALHEVIMEMLKKYTVDINDDYRQLINFQVIAGTMQR